jgi:MFS family permease
MRKKRLNNPMSPVERKAVLSLASIFSLRMFGLFMLLPVLAIYADELSGTTPVLLGLALGIYGLTQAIFQIPSGILSDRFDRKKVIACGLVVFALGSIIAALSTSIIWLIIGRAVQGAGAISAAILALNADLTRKEQRTKSMAVIGISIGFTFLMSLILAPVLYEFIGIDGLFWLIAGLSMLAILVLYKVVPSSTSTAHTFGDVPVREQISNAVKNRQLMQLNIGILVSHLVLTALFLVLPTMLIEKSGLGISHHWKIYAPVLMVSVVGMVPFVIGGSKTRYVTVSYRLAIVLLLLSTAGLWMSETRSMLWMLVCITLFFSAFNALESLLPSLVSQIAPASSKGTAIGVYNTFQFSGIFVGGLSGGLFYSLYDVNGVLLFCAAAVLIWLLVTSISSSFKLTRTRVVEIGHLNSSQRKELIDRIGRLKGIEEVRIVSGETVAYLEVDDDVYDSADIEQLITT